MNKHYLNLKNYCLSIILDMILLYGCICVSTILIFVSASIIGGTGFSMQSYSGQVVILVTLAVWGIYFLVIFRKTGQTLGLKLFRLKAVPAFGYELGYYASFCWGFFLSNPVTAFLSVLVGSLPPYETMLERITNTRIIEV